MADAYDPFAAAGIGSDKEEDSQMYDPFAAAGINGIVDSLPSSLPPLGNGVPLLHDDSLLPSFDGLDFVFGELSFGNTPATVIAAPAPAPAEAPAEPSITPAAPEALALAGPPGPQASGYSLDELPAHGHTEAAVPEIVSEVDDALFASCVPLTFGESTPAAICASEAPAPAIDSAFATSNFFSATPAPAPAATQMDESAFDSAFGQIGFGNNGDVVDSTPAAPTANDTNIGWAVSPVRQVPTPAPAPAPFDSDPFATMNQPITVTAAPHAQALFSGVSESMFVAASATASSVQPVVSVPKMSQAGTVHAKSNGNLVATNLMGKLENGTGNIGSGSGRNVATAVCRGEMKNHAMWRRLQRLKAIPTSVGLNLMDHGDDVAGKEAIGREAPRKHGTMFEKDGGRARLVSAIRAAEEGDLGKLIQCRSNPDKRLALDTATRFTNQGLILQVLWWMRETMRHDRFMCELAMRPKATLVYVDYLKDTKRWDLLERFLVEIRQTELGLWGFDKQLQRNDTVTELAFVKVRQATQASDPGAQLSALKDAYDFISAVPANMIWESSGLADMSQVCKDWQELLIRQVEIERADLNLSLLQTQTAATDLSNISAEVKTSIWQKFPRTCVIGVPVLELLQYLALYHGAEPENSVASPKGLRKALSSISDKMFWFAAYTSLARRGAWEAIKGFTEASTLLTSNKKYTCAIGWRPLINLLFEFGDLERNPALRSLAIHFAQQMENRLEAYDLCVNKELWEAALQCCVDAKDEDRLMELRISVSKSIHQDKNKYLQQIDDVYSDTRIKWHSELETMGPPKTVFGSTKLATGVTKTSGLLKTVTGYNYLSKMAKKAVGNRSVNTSMNSSMNASHNQSMNTSRTSNVFGGGRIGLTEDD